MSVNTLSQRAIYNDYGIKDDYDHDEYNAGRKWEPLVDQEIPRNVYSKSVSYIEWIYSLNIFLTATNE